jgi:hypothetical protein
MNVFSDRRSYPEKHTATLIGGAAGGLAAVGLLLLSRRAQMPRVGGLGSDLKERVRSAGAHARSAARRLGPARLRRLAGEQARLTELEDRVLDAFLGDAVLSERGIDVGAISHGIIELSGSVWTAADSQHAVQVANRIPGVTTVVNRMSIETDQEARAREDSRWTGRNIGMGQRRQGKASDPDQRDDSQWQRDAALREADRAQWGDEGMGKQPRVAARPEVQSPWRAEFADDELDNQDPHGQHTSRTLDEQPQAMNSAARVGESPKTATHLRLEQAELPTKPHGDPLTEE